MTSSRPYRSALGLDFVKEEIQKNKQIQFDPEIADTFLDILNKNYNDIETIQKKYK